jgi:hypothetical protein
MNSKNFSDLFPPPEFLNIPYAGLSISDTAVRVIQFSGNKGDLRLLKFAEKILPDGLVVAGLITNTDEVAKILREMRKNLKLCHIKVSLPEEKAYLFTTKIPVVAQKEIRGAIEFKMEENVPVPVADLVFDYSVPDPNAHHDHLNVVVSALPVSVIDAYIETMKAAELSLLSLEIESQAVARAILPLHDPSACIIAHFGVGKVGLYVAYRRIVHFTSTISLKGISSDDYSYVSSEIKKLQIYWQTLKENDGDEKKKIEKIIVCGENLSPDLESQLGVKSKITASFGNVWLNAFDLDKKIPEISRVESLKYAPAVGLALPSRILF